MDLNPAISEAIAGAGGRTDTSRRCIKKQIPHFVRDDKYIDLEPSTEELGVGGDGFEGVGSGG